MALGRNISPGQGETYYRKDDYYLEREGGDEHKLEWGGKLAPELGLSGKANASDWKNALNGHFPDGIEIKGGSFKDPKTGELLKRAGTDFVIEAPKTISMLYAATDNQAIKDWIMKTQGEVEKLSFDYLESQIGSRQGKDGKNWETTGKALYGHTRHLTNREGECHIHGHGVFLNLTQNSSGKYKAMTNDRMMQYQRQVKEMGEAHWAKRIREARLEIDKGKYGEVQLAGFTREQIEAASSRSRDIEQYIKDKWGLEWSKLPREERNEKRFMHDEAWERTRKAKKVHELDGLEERWKEEAKVIGSAAVGRRLEEQFEKGIKPKYLSSEKRLEIARDSLSFAVEHHTERESAVKEGELIRTALQDGRGKITMEDLKKAVDEAKASGNLLRQADNLAKSKQNLMTSREAMEREKRILSFEKAGRGAVTPLMNPMQAENAIKGFEKKEGLILDPEQKAAARMFLTTDNRYSCVNGYAGTGKTTMLKPAIEILKELDIKVIGLGPQHSAVNALKDAGIIESQTLQSWLADRQAGKSLDARTVVVIDEAGLINAKDMESAMNRIEKAGAIGKFVGDRKQFESVEAGPALSLMQDAGMETVYVTKMQRQRNASENIREAARLSVDSPEKALEKLEVREIRNPGERYRAMAEEYLKSKDPKETLVLTGTHEARKSVNEHIRKSLGLSGKGNEFTRYEAGDFTKAQKKRIDSYEVGQDIRFNKDYKKMGVKEGEIGRVTSVDKSIGTIRISFKDKKDVTFAPARTSGKSHEIGQIKSAEISKGDRIRITGNALKKEGITNGKRGEVVEVVDFKLNKTTAFRHRSMPEQIITNRGPYEKTTNLSIDQIMKIRFDGEKEARTIKIKNGFIEMDHGYAQTGHSAQGLGAGTVILDLQSGSKTLNQRSFYTNLTRTKENVVAFTDNREKLTLAVSRETAKTLAHDIEERPKKGQVKGQEKDQVKDQVKDQEKVQEKDKSREPLSRNR